jgi:hypothetical protein
MEADSKFNFNALRSIMEFRHLDCRLQFGVLRSFVQLLILAVHSSKRTKGFGKWQTTRQ